MVASADGTNPPPTWVRPPSLRWLGRPPPLDETAPDPLATQAATASGVIASTPAQMAELDAALAWPTPDPRLTTFGPLLAPAFDRLVAAVAEQLRGAGALAAFLRGY